MQLFRQYRAFISLLIGATLGLGISGGSMAADVQQIQASQMIALADQEAPELLKTLEELVATKRELNNLLG